MPSDIVRFNGKVITRGRALAMGLTINDETGVATAADGEDFDAEDEAAEDSGELTRGQKAARTRAANKAAKDAEKLIEPLRPQNVDHDGQPITDPAALAAIAAATEAGEPTGSAAEGAGDDEDDQPTAEDEAGEHPDDRDSEPDDESPEDEGS